MRPGPDPDQTPIRPRPDLDRTSTGPHQPLSRPLPRLYGSTTCTVGGVPFQVQNTEYVFPLFPPPSLKSTRIQASFVHTCIDQPGSGVAETSFAERAPSSNTTLPPSVR